MQYRRSFLPGGTFFFTVVTADRRPSFAEQENIATLREAFRTIRLQRPFRLDAAVVLPDHLHCIWTLPPGDADFSTRWRLWQHRYWEHMLRDETDYRHHVEYIHFNPVKHGYVKAPLDWPYSSFRRYVKAGVYPPDWGGDLPEFNGVGQE
jgi:putative transposase